MEMKRPPTSGSRQAPLVQVGLAALVAGSLFMFATLAFRTGFFEDGPNGVRAASAAPQANRPVVLPAASAEPEVQARRQQRPERPDRITLAQLPPETDDVLVTRIDESNERPTTSPDRHRNKRGNGHDKDKGKGHKGGGDKGGGDKGGGDKGRDHEGPEEAKEEDDDRDDDDDDDARVAGSDDDDSEASGRAGSGGGSGSESGSGSENSDD